MEARNLYRVLGVSPSESSEGIRARYRELARRLHPDRAGEETSAAFREVTEAYVVLSDPDARREHDEAIARAERQSRPARPFPEPMSGRSPRAAPESMRAHAAVTTPPAGASAASITVRATLPAADARSGGLFTLALPAAEPCAYCGGTGALFLPCLHCRGVGAVLGVRPVRLRIQPMLPGEVARVTVPLGAGFPLTVVVEIEAE